MASNEFWMYDVTQLFRSFDLLPSPEDSLSTKLNTITRMALIACVVIAVYKPMLAFSTMIIVMVVTMSVYSSAIGEPTIEQFEQGYVDSKDESNSQQLYEFMREYNSIKHPDVNKVGFPTSQKRFCNDAVLLEYDTNHTSINQKLVGGPNPKTRITPIIAPPSHDLDSWRNNDFAVHSQINKETNFDADMVGYNYGILPTKCKECMYIPCQCKVLQGNDKTENENIIEGFRDFKDMSKDGSRDHGKRDHGKRDHGSRNRHHGNRRYQIINDPTPDPDQYMTPKKEIVDDKHIIPCFESPRRDNIITQTLQPGVFQKSHIGEPINSNIGISYLQQWGPTEVQQTDDMIKYTMHDPKNTIITPQSVKEPITQDHTNVYDPRFTGYGTSYRSYVDKLTGRPKFFYDDVDAITMPNYITRSNVDVFPWANTYGSDKMLTQSEGDEYRQLANNAFTDSAITFRTELQERLMRKRNAELWQLRVAPISTMARLGSSMKSCL